MKKILLPFAIGIFSISFLACQSDSQEKTPETKTSTDIENSFPKEKLDKLSNTFSGYWLSEPYLKNIERTKSIYDNRDYPTSLFGFILKKDELEQNKGILHGFSDHEGGFEAPLSYNPDKNIFENKLNTGEGFNYFKNPLTIRLVDDTHIELSFEHKKEHYRKVLDEQTELRRILLTGKYTDLLSENKVTFELDGYVTGISGYNYYELYYDFGEGLWMDAIFVSNTEEKEEQNTYHYKIKDDTIRLYQINGEIPDYSVGELTHELVREK